MNDHQMNLKKVATQAMEEAEKLTDTIDRANAERKLKPLLEARKSFVFILASQFAKMILHREYAKF